MYKLFLDDERSPVNPDEWIIARTFNEAVAIHGERGCPNYISFDHDLGSDKTGYDFAHYLICMDHYGISYIPNDFAFYVHSQNPVGRENITQLLKNYVKKVKNGDSGSL